MGRSDTKLSLEHRPLPQTPTANTEAAPREPTVQAPASAVTAPDQWSQKAPGKPLNLGTAFLKALDGLQTPLITGELAALKASKSSIPADHSFLTGGGTRLDLVPLDEYRPKVNMRLLPIREPALGAYLIRQPNTVAKNVEHMQMQAVIAGLKQWAQAPSSQLVLKRVGAGRLENLSPRQAIEISTQVARDLLNYDLQTQYDRKADGSYTEASKATQAIIDARGVDTFFVGGGLGLCRTFAEVTHGVFSALKQMQDPHLLNELQNTYATMPMSLNHQWNAFFTVQANGHLLVTQTDATHTDSRIPGQAGGGDYTFGHSDVRLYYLQRDVQTATGNVAVSRLLADYLAPLPPITLARLGLAHVETHGGLSTLSNRLDAMTPPERVDAKIHMAADLQEALDQHRAAHNRPPHSRPPPSLQLTCLPHGFRPSAR